MKEYDFDAIGRQAIHAVEHAVRQAPVILRNLQSADPFDLFMLCVTLGAIAVVCSCVRRWRKGGQDSILDRVLFRWDRANPLTVRDLVAGGIHVAGGTGSGKTSSFRQIASAILAFGNTSVLVLCPKHDEYLEWLRLAKEAGRSRDVILIDPEHENYLNLIGHVARQARNPASVAQEVTDYLATLRTIVMRKVKQAGGDAEFWKDLAEQLARCAITLLVLAGEEVSAVNIARLIVSAPRSHDEKKTDTWKKGYCNQCIQRAFAAVNGDASDRDFDAATTYMTHEWPNFGEKTRSSISVGTMAALSVLNSGLAWKMFGNATTFSLTDAIEGRKIVIVNMPPDVHGSLGRLATAGIKHLWQTEILRRKVTPKSPVSVIWADESSEFITSFDASYLSRCRSSLGSMVYLTQSLASYRDVLPGDQADASIKALLGNFTLKAFFALGDNDTAKWAADLVGQELRMLASTSTTEAEFNLFEIFPERPKVTNGFNESWQHIVRPEEFQSGLRTGSKVHKYQVDAMIVRFGGKFANGLPVIQTTFDQRK